MAMSDEAMFAPPQGITIEAVNGMLAERLAQKHGKASLLRAFIPLPPPFSPVQLIELHVLKSNFYYRYHDDGSDVTATVEYQGEMVDYSRHAVLLGSSGMAELRFIRTHGSRFTPGIAHCLTGWHALSPRFCNHGSMMKNNRWRCVCWRKIAIIIGYWWISLMQCCHILISTI